MLRWYVVQSKPRKEVFLQGQLTAHQVECYLPCLRSPSFDCTTRKTRPYFPGYLFVHVDLTKVGTSMLRWMPGAVGLVFFGEEPGSIQDATLSALQARIERINQMDHERLVFRPGERVSIHDGPFKGYLAIFDTNLPGRERARVLLKLVQDQTMRVDLPVNLLQRVV